MTTIAITTLIGLVLTAYGWIFRMVLKRIDTIEKKQEISDANYVKILTVLAKIQTDIEWIKEKKCL